MLSHSIKGDKEQQAIGRDGVCFQSIQECIIKTNYYLQYFIKFPLLYRIVLFNRFAYSTKYASIECNNLKAHQPKVGYSACYYNSITVIEKTTHSAKHICLTAILSNDRLMWHSVLRWWVRHWLEDFEWYANSGVSSKKY